MCRNNGEFSDFFGLAYQGKDIVFRSIIEYQLKGFVLKKGIFYRK
jgi:hypothetical protein